MKAAMLDFFASGSLVLSGIMVLLVELWGIVKIWIIIRDSVVHSRAVPSG